MKFTIITVCFNSQATLEETILSVACQSYPGVEHLVVDGGSIDGTLDIIRRYQDKGLRWVSEPDRGMYDAMNKGIAMATGDVIGILNSDDIYADDHVLERVSTAFADPGIEACYADLVYVDPRNTDRVVRHMKGGDYHDGLFQKGWCPPHPTFFVRRETYARLGGYDLGYAIGNDVELMMRFLERHRVRSQYLPGVMVKMRKGGVSNRSVSNIFRQNVEILRAARHNNIKVEPITFVISKIITRFWQNIRRPSMSIE